MTISIIIPTYNRAALLKEAVQSCLDQTYSAVEIIIVDDGSTDGTEMMVSQALQIVWKNRNIKYIKQTNSGASAARNLGLQLATGDYIQFLDSDDLLFPVKLSLQVQCMLTTGAEGCASYGIMGSRPEDAQEILGDDFISVRDLMHRMCSGRVHVMCTPAPLWKRSVLQNLAGWATDIAFGDDLEFHIRVLCAVEKMAFIPEKLFFVREHTSNRLSDASNNLRQIESGIKTQQRVTATIKKNGLWDKEFQRGILKNARTLYANYLLLADESRIGAYEKWLRKIAYAPTWRLDIFGLILLRNIFGQKLILKAYKAMK